MRLALAGAHEDVEADDIAGGELILGYVVAWGDPADDHVVCVNHVPLLLVGQDTLDSIALELLGDSLNHFCDIVVGGGLGNFALSGLESVPRSKDHVSFASADGSVADHHGCCRNRGVAIEVRSTDATHTSKEVIISVTDGGVCECEVSRPH